MSQVEDRAIKEKECGDAVRNIQYQLTQIYTISSALTSLGILKGEDMERGMREIKRDALLLYDYTL